MIKPYPHMDIQVSDLSVYEPVTVDHLPIHRPMYMMRTFRGPVGVPVWCPDYTTAARVFGEETFDPKHPKYFSRDAYFLSKTLTSNGAFIVRLADTSSKAARLIFEVSLEEKLIPQYEKDVLGNRKVDPDTSEWIPLLDSSDEPVYEEGIELAWHVRTELLPNETSGTDMPPRTEGDRTYYPVFLFNANSVGEWGNNVALALSYEATQNDRLQVDRVGTLFYTLRPFKKTNGISTLIPLRDGTGNIFNSFSLRPNTVDPATTALVSIDDAFNKLYHGTNILPMRIVVHANNLLLASNRCARYQSYLFHKDPSEIADNSELGWLINMVSARDLENKPYDHIHVIAGDQGELLGSNAIYYLRGGTDGNISDTSIESYLRSYLKLDINPFLTDKARYPVTHIFDTGHTLETKYTLIDFTNTRDDVKVYIATQDSSLPMFSKMQDESIGSVLRARALLMRESILKGTDACRITIFQQCGIPKDNHKVIVPATLWSAMKHAEYQNRDFMDREPKGLPFSDISIFKELNWVPAHEDFKARSWDTGLNYCQHYTMQNLHYAAIRSVYPYDTSVLVDDTFTDAIVFSKHVIRQSWARFAGTTLTAAILHDKIKNDLTDRLSKLYNGKYSFTVRVYQTEEERKLGFVHHVALEIESPAQHRTWTVDILCKRDGLE